MSIDWGDELKFIRAKGSNAGGGGGAGSMPDRQHIDRVQMDKTKTKTDAAAQLMAAFNMPNLIPQVGAGVPVPNPYGNQMPPVGNTPPGTVPLTPQQQNLQALKGVYNWSEGLGRTMQGANQGVVDYLSSFRGSAAQQTGVQPYKPFTNNDILTGAMDALKSVGVAASGKPMVDQFINQGAQPAGGTRRGDTEISATADYYRRQAMISSMRSIPTLSRNDEILAGNGIYTSATPAGYQEKLEGPRARRGFPVANQAPAQQASSDYYGYGGFGRGGWGGGGGYGGYGGNSKRWAMNMINWSLEQ
jgi:hypothetical protein